MSGVIHKLPEHVSNQIAAGEVIQRPASVVKELMENAVDAGATSIEVHVLDAGRTSIQVVDDGVGMSAEDARLCFERHATSKLTSAEDLFALATKGFRGEALASIASIAHVELTTRRAEDEVGISLRCHGSELLDERPKACAAGTVFQVRNLFYNVPARRNFLKSDAVELRHIVDEFQRVAFAHPNLAFTLTHQHANLFQLRPGTFRQRIVGILGAKYDERLVPVSEQTDVVTVEGFVGKPQGARRTRGEQFLFVNGRFVKHGLLYRAILRAYEGLLPEGSYPLVALQLTVDPAKVDVNIHPTKVEVKLEEEQPLLAIVKSAVKRGLGAHNVAPSIDFDVESGLNLSQLRPGTVVAEPTISVDPSYNPFRSTSPQTSSLRSGGGGNGPTLGQAHGGWRSAGAADWKEVYKVLESDEQPAEREAAEVADRETRLDAHPETAWEVGAAAPEILQWKGAYLLVPTDEGVTAVHIRRAHMRVLYETYLARAASAGSSAVAASQGLVVPEEITLTKAEVLALDDARPQLKAMGLEVDVVGEDRISITAVPTDMTGRTRDAVDAVLASYHDGPWDQATDRMERWAKSWAHQAAMQGTQALSLAARRRLVEDLWGCTQPQIDPLGRPTMTHWTDIEELFR